MRRLRGSCKGVVGGEGQEGGVCLFSAFVCLPGSQLLNLAVTPSAPTSLLYLFLQADKVCLPSIPSSPLHVFPSPRSSPGCSASQSRRTSAASASRAWALRCGCPPWPPPQRGCAAGEPPSARARTLPWAFCCKQEREAGKELGGNRGWHQVKLG